MKKQSMRTGVYVLFAAVAIAGYASPNPIFEVKLEEVVGTLACSVTFYRRPPSPPTVDKILRDSLQSSTLMAPSRDIVAMAFLDGSSMSENQYSGPLVYKAAEKRIMTIDESSGVKTSTADKGAYLLETKELKTLQGIKPERRWLSVSLVFSKAPTIHQAYEAALLEAELATKSGLDVDVSVKVGNKGNRTSWRPLADPKGGYVYASYKASSRTLFKKNDVFKKIASD